MRFENSKAQNNCYINSVLHIYLRVHQIKEGLERILSRTTEDKCPSKISEYGGESLRAFTALMEVVEKAYEDPDAIVPMNSFRKILGNAYPHTFKYGATGDAQTFFSWLHQLFTQNLPGKQEISDIVKETYEMELIKFGFGNESSFDDEAKKSFWYTVPMYSVIPELENRYSKFPEDLLQNVQGKFVDLVKATSCYDKKGQKEALRAVCRGTKMPEISISVDFLQPPKILTFYLEYQNYFDNINMTQLFKDEELIEDSFATRVKLIHLLPQEFSLDILCQDTRIGQDECSLEVSYDSFKDNPQNVFYTLKSFIGYYGCHYMSFIFEDGTWFLCEDTRVKSIGDFDEMRIYIEKCKIIPYLVFYERVYRKEEEKLAKLELSTESTNDWEISSADKKDAIKTKSPLGISGFDTKASKPTKEDNKKSDDESEYYEDKKGYEYDSSDGELYCSIYKGYQYCRRGKSKIYLEENNMDDLLKPNQYRKLVSDRRSMKGASHKFV
ncbi:unnamed protein product [Moneuplotes crassus]|uniref:USP domain-containing protein n=1 Tax=Euplotes crassus TaxID=5936 RepID=A0AAD1U1N1_EUPCR|nr:unnamed protein product [Moneuplotes crassus]